MAPEDFMGVVYHAKPVDVWSCGIILVEMLTADEYHSKYL
jgi:serine/threonine protein kinase